MIKSFRVLIWNYIGKRGQLIQVMWDEQLGNFYLTGKDLVKTYKTQYSVNRFMKNNRYRKMESREVKEYPLNPSKPLYKQYMDGDITVVMFLNGERCKLATAQEQAGRCLEIHTQFKEMEQREGLTDIQRMRVKILMKKIEQLREGIRYYGEIK